MLRAVLDRVADQANRGRDRVHPGAAPDELLEDVVLRGPAQPREVVAALFGHREVHGDQDRRRAVDRERDGDLPEIHALEGRLEIVQRVDRHADPADLALGLRIVGVHAALRGQVARDVQPGLAVGDQVVEALVGIRRVAEPGVLAHGPGLLAVHEGMDPARERVLAGRADLSRTAGRFHVGRRVERLDLDPRLVDDGAQRPVRQVFRVHGAFVRM